LSDNDCAEVVPAWALRYKDLMKGKSRKEQLEAMLQDDPQDPELRYMLAMEYVSQGDDEGAVRCFREIFTVAPNYPPAYHQGARALQRLNLIKEARDVLLRGIPLALAQGNSHAAGEMQELLDNLD
jgi:Tfp pilus assembly protein PilF